MLASEPGVIKLLLEHGADPTAKNYEGLLCLCVNPYNKVTGCLSVCKKGSC